MKKKVLVGLSGGVDSSVAARILIEQGYEVIGVTMRICDLKKYPNISSNGKSSCFSLDKDKDLEDASNAAKKLGIPFHVVDLSDKYEEIILNYFKNEYKIGRTPNPCIKCNSLIKFGLLMEESKKIGIDFDYFSTGHYAKIEFNPDTNRYLLKKGDFSQKDQSYFLSPFISGQLSKIIFPLGNYTKKEVREIALNIGLSIHEKRESQDFYSGDYTDLLDEKGQEGNIVDINGRSLGRHRGIENYTIGQRKGLGISSNYPLYVVEINKDKNEIVVDTEKGLFNDNLIAGEMNWIAFENLENEITAKARIRYRHKESEAVVIPLENKRVKVIFKEPQKSITPGQALVIYDGDVVLGGGFIE